MQIYHQCGHNFVWNIQSLQDDHAGDGLIISPLNVDAESIESKISAEVRAKSWMDPQFYRPHDSKSNLASYPFFPGNVLEDFNTTDFQEHAADVAKQCLEYQHDLGLKYLVIPTRFYDELHMDHLAELGAMFVEPFIQAYSELGLTEPLLLTVIAKQVQLVDGAERDALLTWATSYPEVSGIYLVLDNNFASKQIQDPAYLAASMRFIRVLRNNELEVHLGYSGLEGLLFSVADPTSVSVGSYENLRSFAISRLETSEPGVQQGPRPRIYSDRLYQSVVDTTLAPLRELYPSWQDLFGNSPYKEFLLDPKSSLSFQRSEIYKHYFIGFSEQVAGLPKVISERFDHLRTNTKSAIALFDEIRETGIVLDPDSDDTHLVGWLNALAMFEAKPE